MDEKIKNSMVRFCWRCGEKPKVLYSVFEYHYKRIDEMHDCYISKDRIDLCKRCLREFLDRINNKGV